MLFNLVSRFRIGFTISGLVFAAWLSRDWIIRPRWIQQETDVVFNGLGLKRPSKRIHRPMEIRRVVCGLMIIILCIILLFVVDEGNRSKSINQNKRPILFFLHLLAFDTFYRIIRASIGHDLTARMPEYLQITAEHHSFLYSSVIRPNCYN